MTMEFILRRDDGTVIVRQIVQAMQKFDFSFSRSYGPSIGAGIIEGGVILRGFEYTPSIRPVEKSANT